MGGIIIITAVMVSSFIMAGASVEVLLAVLVMLAFGGIFWDDYIKVVLKRSLGLKSGKDRTAAFGGDIVFPFSHVLFGTGNQYHHSL